MNIMKTCKDCINVDNCVTIGFCDRDTLEDGLPNCKLFKDKSKFIALPCSIGDTSYAIAYEKENKLLPICHGDCGATTEEEARRKFGIVKKIDEEKTSELLKDLKFNLFATEFVSDEESEILYHTILFWKSKSNAYRKLLNNQIN